MATTQHRNGDTTTYSMATMRRDRNSESSNASSSSSAAAAVMATTSLVLSFAAGAVVMALGTRLLERRRRDRRAEHAGATPIGNDLSLFYGDVTQLTTIPDRQRFLPQDIYRRMVLDAVVCCLDIVLVRINTTRHRKECLLVYRASEPVKGVWWWPGGRLLKGETFFAAAQRKAQQETGLSNVRPVQVLGVWNTLFPTSAWDTETERGTQTVNPIVLVEILDPDASVQLDDTSEQYRWISLDPEEAIAAGEDPYVQQALLRLQAWDPDYIKL